MTKEDMALWIEAEDALADMDKVLEQLTGQGYANGVFVELDRVFDVICHNSHVIYRENLEEGQELFFKILLDRNLSPEQRADILMNETVWE